MMETLIVYFLKVSLVSGVAYLFYKSVLQHESFFAANRLYLLACLVLAFALPFVAIPQLVSHQGYITSILQPAHTSAAEPVTTVAEQVPPPAAVVSPQAPPVVRQQEVGHVGAPQEVKPQQAQDEGFSWLFWLSALYLFGVAVFALTLLLQVGAVLYKVATSTDRIRDGDCVIVNTATPQAPCSFFRYTFIYPDDYDFETYEQIIAHEKIHARLGHSFDLLLAEIAVIILWFNPLIWLWRKEVEKNNEYQTDAVLLEKEVISRDRYQLSLVQIAAPNKPLSITTNYNQSLLKQRIMMMNAKKSTWHNYWKYTFLGPLFFGTLLLMNAPAQSMSMAEIDSKDMTMHERVATLQERLTSPVQENSKIKQTIKQQEKQQVKEKNKPAKEELKSRQRSRYPFNNMGSQTDMSKGYWYSSSEGGEYCLQFKGNKSASSWNMSRCFDKGLFQKRGDQEYVITKEMGTLLLKGNLDAEAGQGTYTFTEDASFKKYLADNHITSNENNLMFHLFFGDVNKQYVAFLKQTYQNVEGERLLELAIHGISLQDYQNYMALFQKYSNKKPSIEDVVAARIHGIDQAYVQELQAMGFKSLSMEKMMEAKIHDIDRSYVEGLRKAGFDNLPIDKIVAAKIHGINPESIKELQGLGFGNLSLDKMMEMRIQGVDAASVADLRAAGFDKLTTDQVVQAKIFGLNAATVKEIRALGFKNLDFEDMITARIHGVDAAYVQDLKKAGFADITMDKAVEAKIHGITGDFIKKARQDGYNLNSLDKYIELKIHGMALESLKEKD
ncbi:M56 family metallopeptidase [Pontibacter chitinilyticus]|uniref:M56 family metallopeptidase n=1 Tax=Pontibacter chitinilyticus TaxID=2674989 RepID=UPI00321B5DD9